MNTEPTINILSILLLLGGFSGIVYAILLVQSEKNRQTNRYFAAWFMWSFAHVMFLIGFRNRLSVMLNWAWYYFSFNRGARLITGKKPK